MKILLINPPFSQINTVYPAILQLAGFLKKNNYETICLDLSNKTFLKIFSSSGLSLIFNSLSKNKLDENLKRIISLKEKYIGIIDNIISFLQGKDNSLAYIFANPANLPQAKYFENINYEILEKEFGSLGIIDKAKYFCSLVIDDLVFFIKENISPFYELSKYAEKLAESNRDFDILYNETKRECNIIENFMLDILNKQISTLNPNFVAISIPFPGNLLSSLIIGKYIKNNYPEIKIIFGGGYINTELREIQEERIFEFCDFITLDDGELPLLNILENYNRNDKSYVRTFFYDNGIKFQDNANQKILAHNDIPAPDYTDINPDDYPALLELLNPMHRLWSDGFSNKLTLAHGCYWAKCTFCDVTLDYIGRYNPANATILVDHIEQIVKQTGRRNFHFTDEAAPSALLRNLSIEILKRNLKISWWGNIRFEKSFTPELTYLMAKAGFIAVTGGIEVANERLLKLINKGVTIKQAAQVCKNFKSAGILVHAYLMYGYPTQTEQEIIDSLEIVRQFFLNNLFDSAFWHQFSLTIHSPIYKDYKAFGINKILTGKNKFANNNVDFIPTPDLNYSKYTFSLDKALYNFMHGIGLNWDVRKWFDFKVNQSTINRNLIKQYLNEKIETNKNGKYLIWFENYPQIFKNKIIIHLNDAIGEWNITSNEYEFFSNFVEILKNDSNIYELNKFENSTLDFIKNNKIFNEILEEKIVIII